MRSRRLLWSGVGVVGTVGAIGGAWMLSLPPARGSNRRRRSKHPKPRRC